MIGCGEGSRKIVMEISLWMIVAEVAPSKAYILVIGCYWDDHLQIFRDWIVVA